MFEPGRILALRDGRRAVVDVPVHASAGGELRVSLGKDVKATRLTLVRMGSVTHSLNHEQRFFALDFSQQGTVLRARLPADANQLLPGYWLLFVFDAQGVPSMGRPVLVSSPAVAG